MRKKVFIGVALLLVAVMLAACGGIPQEDYDAAVADKKAADAKVTSLTSQLSAAKSEATKAKSDLAAAQSELTAAESDLAAAESDLASAKSAASSAQSAASSAKSEVSSLKSEVSSLESDLAAAQATIAELEAAAAAPAEEEEEVVEEEEEVVEEEEEVVEEEEEEVVELSFTPAEYVNEEYGFSVKYPNAWYEETENGDTVFVAIGPPYSIPGVTISISDIEEGVSYAEGTQASLEADGGTGVEIVSETETTTADGSPATLLVLTYTTVDAYFIDAVAIGVEKDGKRIGVFVFTVNIYAPFDIEQMTEVCMTLTFQ